MLGWLLRFARRISWENSTTFFPVILTGLSLCVCACLCAPLLQRFAARSAMPRMTAARGVAARPVVGMHFREEEERRSFSTVPATKDPATLPSDLKGVPAGAGLLAVGFIMNQEMYVVNDETMLAAGWLGLMAVAVNGLSGSLAEMLDERAAGIEAELVAQREEEEEAVALMVAKAEDSIAVNDELIKVCAPENFDEWTKFKMEKTLQAAANDSASQTIRKLADIQRIEETAARRKLTGIIDEVNAGVAAAIAADADFARNSIDEAIAMIPSAKAA